MNPVTTNALRQQALDLLATIDDPNQPHEVRVVASSGLGWSLHYLRDDEGLLAAIPALVRRAIERGDESPLCSCTTWGRQSNATRGSPRR